MQPQVLEAVAALQSTWQNLPDVDRAQAIVRILAAGLSGYELADALDCSEAFIRYLKPLTEALPEEKRLSRLGKISTRELNRRIADRRGQRTQKAQEAAEFACLEAAHRGADHILQWFNKEEKIAYPYAERIVLEARRKLREAEMNGRLPKGKAPTGLAVSDIIHRCDLGIPPCNDAFNFVARYGFLLAVWTYYVMPDGRVREKALDIALSELMTRSI
jgi:hypothetical protein